jgi:hypothetical protein
LDWVEATLESLFGGRDVANGGQKSIFCGISVVCLWLLPLNLSHVFRWNHFVPLSPDLCTRVCLPTIFDKSLGLSWGHFGVAKDALILVEGVTKNRHMCRFFVTPSTQSASWNGAQHSFYCTVCAHSRLYTSLSIMVEPPVPLNWKKTAFWMIF